MSRNKCKYVDNCDLVALIDYKEEIHKEICLLRLFCTKLWIASQMYESHIIRAPWHQPGRCYPVLLHCQTLCMQCFLRRPCLRIKVGGVAKKGLCTRLRTVSGKPVFLRTVPALREARHGCSLSSSSDVCRILSSRCLERSALSVVKLGGTSDKSSMMQSSLHSDLKLASDPPQYHSYSYLMRPLRS